MRVVGLALALALASSAGPAWAWSMPKMFRMDNTWPFKDKDKPYEGTPIRLVGSWTDTVLTQAGQKPQRGFGGRVLFYDREGKKPILVDGQLVVYAFDETGRQPTDNKPTRRYVFPADQLAMHMSMCDMGASYSFWLPWDDAGGPRTEVSLICRFEPTGGAVVTGEQTKHLLPGPMQSTVASTSPRKPPNVPAGVASKPARQTLEDIQVMRNAQQQARLTSFEAPTAAGQPGAIGTAAQPMGSSPERHMTSATIALPQSYQLPDAAALNAGIQTSGYQQAAGQFPQQTMPNAHLQMQAPQAHAYNMAQPAMVSQPMALPQPYAAAPMPLPPQQQQQTQVGAQQVYPGVQAYAQTPAGTNPNAGQIQQQAYYQPVAQPQLMPRQPQMPPVPQPTWQQMQNQQNQTTPTATLNSPAAVQYR